MITNIITATLTAYCSCTQICCPKSSKGLCADGHRPIQGITVAASRSIPLGSKIIYQGHTYTVQDRLAKKYDSRLDFYFNSHKEAKKFGIKINNVIVIMK